MKSMLLDGTAGADGFGGQLGARLLDWLAGRGYASTSYVLREHRIQFCMGDFDCWVKTPGVCRFPDVARDIAREAVASDLLVLLTPVTFGGYSAELKKALDRMICILSPSFMSIHGETHHQPRYDRYPALLAVGLQDRPDDESAQLFRTLVERNARNLHAPSHHAITFPRGGNLADLRPSFERGLSETVAP